jgi:hypothetical protein
MVVDPINKIDEDFEMLGKRVIILLLMYLVSYVFGRQPSLLCLFFQRGSIPELLRCASGHNLHFTQPYWLHDFQAAGFLVVFPRMAFLPVKSLGYIFVNAQKENEQISLLRDLVK